MGLQYGIKEVLDVNVVDFKSKQPLFFVDYAEASTNEVSAERLDLSGGRGNAKLMSFDHSKVSTFTLTLPLVDLKVLAMLAGEELTKGAGSIFKRVVHTIADDGTGAAETDIVLDQAPVAGTVSVFKLEGTRDNGEVMTHTVDVATKTVTLTTPPAVGEEVVVYYQYAAPSSAQKISVKANKFPKAVAIYGTGLARNQEDEQDYPCHVSIFKARPQANFSVTMSGTEATNLELTFDLYEVKDGNGDGQYIDYIFETE